MTTTRLHLGRWEDVLADVECDALISDPPFSVRTHRGHNAKISDARDGYERRHLSYEHWTPEDVHAFVRAWHPRVRGWMAILTDHTLFRAWEAAFSEVGRYVFAPLPCVIRNMTCRMSGDGPSSWTIWLCVARPRTRQFATWGTLPGAYLLDGRTRSKADRIGGKPLSLMTQIVRDYSLPGDLICDPCAGAATTLVAAHKLGRDYCGAEVDADVWRRGADRLAHVARQNDLLLQRPVQLGLVGGAS